jgi:hypothetical protein
MMPTCKTPLTKVNYGFIGKIKIGKSKETQNSDY